MREQTKKERVRDYRRSSPSFCMSAEAYVIISDATSGAGYEMGLGDESKRDHAPLDRVAEEPSCSSESGSGTAPVSARRGSAESGKAASIFARRGSAGSQKKKKKENDPGNDSNSPPGKARTPPPAPMPKPKPKRNKHNKMMRIWHHRASPAPSLASETDVKQKTVDPNSPLIEETFSDLRDKYDVDGEGGELGSGQYGIVRKCTNRETGQVFAVKRIQKSRVIKTVDILRQEVNLLREVSHPNIIELIDVFEDKDAVHLVTELATGGELFDRIVARRNSDEGHFTETEAAVMIRQILDALAYLHDERDIVHRDLKPENFLFATEDDDAPIKIIDFGYARRHAGGQKPMRDEVGTPLYMAPEVMNRKYDRSCDVWSVGVIAYTLLCGYPPFNGHDEGEIYESVRGGRFHFQSPHWDDISPEAKDFICKVLKKDPKMRIGAGAAMRHDWIRKFAPSEGDSEYEEFDPAAARSVDASGKVNAWGGKVDPRRRRQLERKVSAAQFAY